MNTEQNKRVNEQEFSDIKVSKTTEKVFAALRAYSVLFDAIFKMDDVAQSKEAQERYMKVLDAVRDELDKSLISSIIAQQPLQGAYTYDVI